MGPENEKRGGRAVAAEPNETQRRGEAESFGFCITTGARQAKRVETQKLYRQRPQMYRED